MHVPASLHASTTISLHLPSMQSFFNTIRFLPFLASFSILIASIIILNLYLLCPNCLHICLWCLILPLPLPLPSSSSSELCQGAAGVLYLYFPMGTWVWIFLACGFSVSNTAPLLRSASMLPSASVLHPWFSMGRGKGHKLVRCLSRVIAKVIEDKHSDIYWQMTSLAWFK